MERHFEIDLSELKERLLWMGSLAERAVHQAIHSVLDAEGALADTVLREEQAINYLQMEIDDRVMQLLALHQLMAADLRFVLAVARINNDLERIGDEGEKIAAIAARLAMRERPNSRYRELRNLGELVIEMVHDTLDAFARLDTELALAVVRRDRTVDEEYEAIHRQSITFMMEDPRSIRRALDVMWVVRSLERIGDHAKNVCEYLIYLVHGKDVRHTRIEEIEKELHAFRG